MLMPLKRGLRQPWRPWPCCACCADGQRRPLALPPALSFVLLVKRRSLSVPFLQTIHKMAFLFLVVASPHAQGHAKATSCLAALLRDGEGRDASQAFVYIRASAEKGDVESMHNLAVHYNQGDGVAQDFAEAMRWYLKAARRGNAASQCNLGTLYMQGHQGMEKNYPEARKWFEKAAAQGDGIARQNLMMVGLMESMDATYNANPDAPRVKLGVDPCYYTEAQAASFNKPINTPGMEVALVDFSAKPELNGRRGVVQKTKKKTGKAKAKAGQVTVLLDGEDTPMVVRVEKLRKVHPDHDGISMTGTM